MANFRKGDIVTIEATVESHFSGTDVRLRLADSYSDIYAKASQLTMKRSKIEIGDWVDWTVGDMIHRGEVLAASEEHLWVSLGGGDYATVWLPNATRIDADAAPEDVEAA